MPLTERRKADREKMAAAIIALAIEEGAAAHIDVDWPGERAIMIEIEAARGLRLGLDFDGSSSQPDVHVLSWHIASDSDACLAESFCPGHVNPCHFSKATDVAYGFDGLCDILRNRLRLVASGAAFSVEREAAMIAKHGETAVERNARYQRGFDEITAERQRAALSAA